MPHLDDTQIFVRVAQFESISRAAPSLGMPIATMSRRLSVLESNLGVSLLRRMTQRAGDRAEISRRRMLVGSAAVVLAATLKTYQGFPHGMPTTEAATINADLLAFIQS